MTTLDSLGVSRTSKRLCKKEIWMSHSDIPFDETYPKALRWATHYSIHLISSLDIKMEAKRLVGPLRLNSCQQTKHSTLPANCSSIQRDLAPFTTCRARGQITHSLLECIVSRTCTHEFKIDHLVPLHILR